MLLCGYWQLPLTQLKEIDEDVLCRFVIVCSIPKTGNEVNAHSFYRVVSRVDYTNSYNLDNVNSESP